MDQLMKFFQGDLVQNGLSLSDDAVIDSLLACESELRRLKLDLPPPAADASELPMQPFGLFVPPSVEQAIGRRTIETDAELIRGRATAGSERRAAMRRDSRMSISIPPDGGPAFFESLDAGLAAGISRSIEEEDNLSSGTATTIQSANTRREKYARARAGVVRNGDADNSGSVGKAAVNGGTSLVVARQQSSTATARQQKISFRRRGQQELNSAKPHLADAAAPQDYGVSVRL